MRRICLLILFMFILGGLFIFPVDYNSQFISQSVPSTMTAGAKYSVSITFKNTGTETWTRVDNIRLGSQNPRDNTIWGLGRVYLSTTDAIATNQNKTFNFTVTAPLTPGTYNFQWQMLKESVKWFGAMSPLISVTVNPGTYNSAFISQNVPLSMTPGESAIVEVTFKNTGTLPWTASDNIVLGSRGSAYDTWGVNIVYLGPGTILTGQKKTFQFTITAPSIPGTYDFRWRMQQEGIKWFGTYSTNVPISVQYEGSVTWEQDNFELTENSQLNGNNDWTGTPSAVITRTDDLFGNELMIDPAPGDAISMGKFVPQQADGKQVMGMLVKVTGADPTQPTLAKLELRTNENNGWDKKFQIYFGTNIRINYGPTSAETVFIVPDSQMLMDKWYHIRMYISDLSAASQTMDVLVDGELAASNVPLHPGPIVSLVLYGWDRPGAVYLDDLWGIRYQTSPEIDITSPSLSDTVSGNVLIGTQASANVARVEFYADGVLLGTDTTAPFEWQWNTAANPLQPQATPLSIGYYGAVGEELDNNFFVEVDKLDEVNCFTNTFLVGRISYKDRQPDPLDPSAPYSLEPWSTLLNRHLQHAAALNLKTELSLNLNYFASQGLNLDTHLTEILTIAQPYWANVDRVEVLHEPHPNSLTQINTWMTQAKNKITQMGLAAKPLGITFGSGMHVDQAEFTYFNNVVNSAAELDWVGIEAYLKTPGSLLSRINIAEMNQLVSQALTAVPLTKNIVLVQMSYNRNLYWYNIDTLRDLQIPTYLLALSDSRVIGINMFAYGRKNQGVIAFPDLRVPHILVGERNIINPLLPACATFFPDNSGNGRRTVTVKAYDTNNELAEDSIFVIVSN